MFLRDFNDIQDDGITPRKCENANDSNRSLMPFRGMASRIINEQYVSGIFVAWNHVISYENIHHGDVVCYNGKYALYICEEFANPSNIELKVLINAFYIYLF